MPKLIVVRPSGEETTIEGPPSLTAMQLMRDNGIHELLALCGGCMSCSTCHVWVDPAFLQRLPAPSDQERDSLDSVENRKPNSRLSCQILMTDDLDGMRVVPVPED